MRRIRIQHNTRYHYAQPVTLLKHRLHVRPREGHDIRIESSRLDISPNYDILWHRDVYGNSVALVSFREPGDRLEIVSEVVVQHYEEQPLVFLVDEAATQFPFHYDSGEQIDLIPYQMSVFPQDTNAVQAWMAPIWQPGQGAETTSLLERLNRVIVDEIDYELRETPGVQSPAVTLARNRGSCRDLATLFIEACRFCGLAARFVSGYLTSAAAAKDAASTHAWSEVYLPGAGWRGFDSTSGQHVGGDHIAVAVHRHPEAIPPVSGSFVGPAEPKPVMQVEVRAELV